MLLEFKEANEDLQNEISEDDNTNDENEKEGHVFDENIGSVSEEKYKNITIDLRAGRYCGKSLFSTVLSILLCKSAACVNMMEPLMD